MTQEAGEREIEFNQGYDARWGNLPYQEDASDDWKRGWKEAAFELWGDDSVEF
jgi:hypothetical protein